MSADKEYLRAADIAEITGMSLRTVRRWIAEEVIPSTRIGGARLVATADLETVLSPSRDTFQEYSDEIEEYGV